MRRCLKFIAYGACGVFMLGQTRADTPVELKLVPLESPGQVISAKDAKSANSQIYGGMVMPGTMLRFDARFKEYGINIGGTKLKLAMKGSVFTVTDGEKTANLKRNGNGFASIPVRTTGGQNYLLAFPFGSSYASGGYLYARSGGVLRGTIEEQTISIYDDNVDGKYVLADDSVRIGLSGSREVFAPMAKYVATTKGVYEITSLAEEGSSLSFVPYSGQTGKLSIACESPDLELCVVMTSKDAKANFVATARSGKSTEMIVIPGGYDLIYGAVYSTKTRGLVCLLGPGSMKTKVVSADEPAVLSLGGKLQLDFKVQKSGGDRITISSSTFKITGKGGEEYRSYSWDPKNLPQIAAGRNATSVPIGKMSLG